MPRTGGTGSFRSKSTTLGFHRRYGCRAVFLFLHCSRELEADEQETLALLRSLHTEVDQAYGLVQQFAQMLRTRTRERLDAWLEKAKASHIRELQSFVQGVERDKAAIVAGLTLPQNNGLVEGKVNKLIKRMGYGRAGFPLLLSSSAEVRGRQRIDHQRCPREHGTLR